MASTKNAKSRAANAISVNPDLVMLFEQDWWNLEALLATMRWSDRPQ